MANIKQLSARPDDLAPGHRLCGGCGASMADTPGSDGPQ